MNEEKEVLINNNCTFEPSLINKDYVSKTHNMSFFEREQ